MGTVEVLGDRPQIVSTLLHIAREGEPLWAHWAGEKGAPPRTRLLAIAEDELVFDCFSDSSANRRVLHADEVDFQTQLDGVDLQFSCGRGEATVHAGRAALRLAMPAELQRLQRREYFRVPAALPCEVVLAVDGKVRILELRIADLSIGGLKLVGDLNLSVQPGEIIERCQLKLGEEGTLSASLEVRNAETVRNPNGVQRRRIGCRFLSLPGTLQAQLARFITKLERRKLAR